MSFQNTLLLGLGLGIGSALALAGCGSSGSTPATKDPNAIIWTDYPKSTTAVSFKTDVMPIFGFSCVASDCHNPRDKKAGLNLGPKCKYDPTTKGCNYPDVADPDTTKPQPLTQADIDTAYSDLMAAAATVKSPATMRVVPNDPEGSFLMLKLADTQNDAKYKFTCDNQDPSHDPAPAPPCGSFMPLTGSPLSTGTSRPKFDRIADWIAQGAPKN